MEDLAQRLLRGESLKESIASTFKDGRKLYEAVSRNPKLRSIYDVAMICRADLLAHEIVEISDSKDDPQRARNRIDSRKWLASKLMPRRYGDRLELSVQGEISINEALAAAHSRVQALRAQFEDAEVVEQSEINSLGPTEAGSWPDIFS